MTADSTHPAFPVDPVTLAMLAEACDPSNPDRSPLYEFLNFGAVLVSEERIDHNVVVDTYADDAHPYSPQEVIWSLCNEVERLRALHPGNEPPSDSTPFPVDSVTLAALAQSCDIDTALGHSTLFSFLTFCGVVEPDVIWSLCVEIERLRVTAEEE